MFRLVLLFILISSMQSNANVVEERAPHQEISITASLVPNFLAWTTTFTAKLGNSQIGATVFRNISTTPSGFPWSTTIGSSTRTGSSDFTIYTDSCTGASYGNPSFCNVQFAFTPTSAGSHSADFVWPVTLCQPDPPNPPDCHSSSLTIHTTGFAAEPPPSKECRECGSDIGVDSQTMIESVPVVGTDLRLYYANGRSADYVDPYNTLGVKSNFNPNGMSVSNVHFLDTNQNTVYLGDGSSMVVTPKTIAGPLYQTVSEDGSEVYLFSTTGIHQSTLYALTGQTKYSFSYNGSGKLSQIDDAFGNSTVFQYDISGDLEEIHAPRGQVTLITLWSGSKLMKYIENPNGEKYEFTYKTGTSLMETFKKPAGQINTFTYDANGRLTQDLGHGGDYWNLSKSGTAPYPVTITSKIGRAKVVTATRSGNDYYLRYEDMPTGAQKSYTHTFSANRVEEQYLGRKSTVERTDDERFGSDFKRLSLVKTKLDAVESSTAFAQTVAYGVGVTPAEFNYDSITKTATTSGRVVTSVYDSTTKATATTTDEGATSSFTIDNYERPVGYQVGSDTAWTLTYGTYGYLDEIVQGTHNKQTFTHNADGYVSKIKNVRNEETLYSYDLSGRVSQVTLPDSRVISYAYDSNGNISGITPPGRPQHVFSQNNFDLLASYQPPSIGVGITKNTTYSYNDDKQLTQISRPDGLTVDYTYDATKGRLDQITTAAGNYYYQYDGTTKKLLDILSPYNLYSYFTYYGDQIAAQAQVRTSDNFLFGWVAFNYDTDHRVTYRTIQGNTVTPTSSIAYTHNDDDKLTAVGNLSLSYTYPSGRLSGTVIGRISDTYTYDSYGDLATYTAVDTPTGGSPTTLYTYSLTRDLGGRITQKVETIQGVTATYDYTYDSAGRLTLVKKNTVTTDSFVYDSNSNRTSGVIQGTAFSATYDDQDRILTYGSRTYNHNNNGDLTRIQWNVTDKTDFVYDVMGNLKQATLPTGTVLAYSMDGLDRRVYKTAGGSYNYRYLFEDQYRIAAQINASGAYTKEFIYATKVNVPDYMITGGNKFRIITDHLGSPRLVVRTDTGVVVQRMDYNTLGLVTADSSPGFQPYAFAGGIHDTHTLLVKFGARDYDPRATGRWTTKDPIRFHGGDTNLYGYVLNDPINFKDPSGLYFEDAIETRSTPNQQMGVGIGLAAAGTVCMKAGAGNLNLPMFLLGVGLGIEGAKNVLRAHDRGAPELPDLNAP